MRSFFLLTICLVPMALLAQKSQTGTWGDQGNGTYINPVLNADYSDPDVIQVKGKYYMVCSEFHFMGIPVLESDDMVNWRIITQIYRKMDFPAYDNFDRYAGGSWAPSLRYHDGRFWLYFCTKDEGLFMSNATDPRGPWSPLMLVKDIKGWEDPCPFWDEDGSAYLGHSVLGAGPIILHKMSPDGTKLLDSGTVIYRGQVAEGTKFYKTNGYYYLCIPEGGVGTGWQTALRAKNIYGPYERKVVLETGSTKINGPHQGALVQTPKGEWWFYHFQSAGAMGRVMHLQPVTWKNNWPEMGIDLDSNGVGEPVITYRKPALGKTFPIVAPQTDDDFNNKTPGLQWQTNHNPVPEAWSLTERKGWLCLKAQNAPDFPHAKNTFTQKIMGRTGEASTEIDFSKMENDQKAGLGVMGKTNYLVGVCKKNGKPCLYYCNNGKDSTGNELTGSKAFLKVTLDLATNKSQLYYSVDDKTYLPIGETFEATWGNWKGSRLVLFSYNEQTNAGQAYFNWFKYQYDGPKSLKVKN